MPNGSNPDGALLRFGQRWTYFPPSIHQLRSQCTMTAAVMGANIAKAGTIHAKPEEAVELGRTTGILSVPPDGYTTTQMLDALRKRYGLELRAQAVPIEGWRRRLAGRGAAIIAVEYPRLPEELRRLAPTFTGGHRMLVVGYDEEEDETSLLDPLRRSGQDRGTRIKLRRIYEAQGKFLSRQVWLREAQAVEVDHAFDHTWDEPREILLRKHTLHRFWDRRRPGRPIEKQPPVDLTVEVDARARFATKPQDLLPSGVGLLHVCGGDRGQLVDTWLEITPEIRAQLQDAPPIPDDKQDAFRAGYRAGRAEERARWKDWLDDAPERGDAAEPDDDEGPIGVGLKALDDPD